MPGYDLELLERDKRPVLPGRDVPLTRVPHVKRPHNPRRWSRDPRTPKVENVFGVMPYRAGLEHVEPGDTVHLNLATYLDEREPEERRLHALTHPRWLQGVNLEILKINGSHVYHLDNGKGSRPWAERVFEGLVIHEDDQHSVIGVMHPEWPGWLKFMDLSDKGVNMRTVADLKGHIGQLTTEAVAAYNQQWAEQQFFKVGTRRLV